MRFLLQRYLAFQFILPLSVSLVFFICFLMIFDLFRMSKLFMAKDIEISFVLGMIQDLALTFLPLALPIAIFFSVMFCMGKLSSDSEYVAMRSAGLSKERILAPFLICAVFCSISLYFTSQEVIPYIHRDFRRKIQVLTSTGLIDSIKEGQFFSEIPNATLFTSQTTDEGKSLKEVFLKLDENERERVIFASEGELIYERDDEALTESLKLKLINGNILTLYQGEEVEKVLFKEYFLPVIQSNFSNTVTPKEIMLNDKELKEVLSMTPEEAKKKYNFKKKDYFNSHYEYWNRKNNSLLVIIFTLLGVALGVKENRGKGRNTAVLGILSLVVFYGMYFGLVGVAKGGSFPIWLVILIPDIVLITYAFRQFRRLDWQS